jgi:hypothetical protein
MARRTSQTEPALAISFFLSGFYPYRSQLFAPYKAVGVQIVTFRDPLIDGANMENTDKLQIARRPGFSIFCDEALGDGEVVNQWYSARNLDGVVIPFFDSSVRLSTFNTTAITTIFTKTTTEQGYVNVVGNMAYFSDGAGADMQKWDSVTALSGINPSAWGLASPTVTPMITNLGCWLPKTHFSSNQAILDPNGAVEVAFSSTSGTTTQTNTTTVFAPLALAGSNGSVYLPKGNMTGVLYQQTKMPANTFSPYAGWTGFGFSIPTGSTILGVKAIISKDQVGTVAGFFMTDQSVRLLLAGSPAGGDHADTTTQWEFVFLDQPRTGGRSATYGSATDTWGVALTPADVNDPGFGIAISPELHGGVGGEDFAEINQTPFPVTLIVFYLPPTGPTGAGITGLNEPNWATILGSTTQDGTVTWTNSGPILTWLPDTNYTLPAVVLDTNSNLQIATVAIDPIEEFNPATAYTAGEFVQFAGLYWVALTTSTGVTPSNDYSVATTVAGVTTTQAFWANIPNPITTGAVVPVWNTTIGGTTADGDYTWTNIGQGTLTETVGTSFVYGFRTIYGHLTTCSPVSINTGSIFGPQSAGVTAFEITGDVVTFTGINNFIPGNKFTVDGLTVGTFLNGQDFTIIPAGLSPTSFSANFTNPDVGLTSDTGTTLPLIATVAGVGTDSPLCNAVFSITAVQAVANIVTITAVNNLFPGLYVTFAGLTNATWLNNLQLQVVNVDPAGAFFQVELVTPNYQTATDTGTATFNAVEIYRVSDGGGIYLFAGAVTNPGGNAPWILDDFATDAALDELAIAPQNNQNDPPPGAPGSTITTPGTITAYWQGRFWMISGNFVYFDAGPDCTNGVPEESWPPGNRFQFAGPAFGLVPTPDGVGLLVYLADRVAVILGGPETISFYATDALGNFGISNPNAIFRDGSIIGQFTTQQQYFDLVGGQKQETGEHIADYLTTNFSAETTYATMHRNGLDVGMFLSNGVDRVIRYGSNISAWSVPSFPLIGAGALRSIETTVGVTTLMLASPVGGTTFPSGFVNPSSGTSVGVGTAWATPENITEGSATTYATVSLPAPGSSQILRALSFAALGIPATAIIKGVTVRVVGQQSTPTNLSVKISPTNAVPGAETHTFVLGTGNTTEIFGGTTDRWGMPWFSPASGSTIGFDIMATRT